MKKTSQWLVSLFVIMSLWSCESTKAPMEKKIEAEEKIALARKVKADIYSPDEMIVSETAYQEASNRIEETKETKENFVAEKLLEESIKKSEEAFKNSAEKFINNVVNDVMSVLEEIKGSIIEENNSSDIADIKGAIFELQQKMEEDRVEDSQVKASTVGNALSINERIAPYAQYIKVIGEIEDKDKQFKEMLQSAEDQKMSLALPKDYKSLEDTISEMSQASQSGDPNRLLMALDEGIEKLKKMQDLLDPLRKEARERFDISSKLYREVNELWGTLDTRSEEDIQRVKESLDQMVDDQSTEKPFLQKDNIWTDRKTEEQEIN